MKRLTVSSAHRRPEVSVAVYDSAAAAIRRAGYEATRSRVRMVVRAQQETGSIPITDFDWWDRLVRECPLAARRQRPVARADRDYRVRA